MRLDDVASDVTSADVASGEVIVERRIRELLESHPPESTPQLDFLGEQFGRRIGVGAFPRRLWGSGLSRRNQGLILERLRSAGVPDPFSVNPIGYGMAGPTV